MRAIETMQAATGTERILDDVDGGIAVGDEVAPGYLASAARPVRARVRLDAQTARGELRRSRSTAGATAVPYGERLIEHVREITPRVDAVMDAAGQGIPPVAIELTGARERVITLSDPRAHGLGVRLSAPTRGRAPRAVDQGMALLAAGTLQMKPRRELPLQQAA